MVLAWASVSQQRYVCEATVWNVVVFDRGMDFCCNNKTVEKLPNPHFERSTPHKSSTQQPLEWTGLICRAWKPGHQQDALDLLMLCPSILLRKLALQCPKLQMYGVDDDDDGDALLITHTAFMLHTASSSPTTQHSWMHSSVKL